jgi:energy-coupling factor transporter ATP-binding protein EcfA2
VVAGRQLVDDQIAHLSGGEQRLLRIVASLAGGAPVSLADNVPGLDREVTDLVLAAIAHANGSHEHPNIHIDHARGVAVLGGRLPSLHPWPEPADNPSRTEDSHAH